MYICYVQRSEVTGTGWTERQTSQQFENVIFKIPIRSYTMQSHALSVYIN